MKSLRLAAVAAVAFIHFKNPIDGSRLFVLNADAEKFGGTSHADGYARDKDGNKLPIGVRQYGPGSGIYRNAVDANITAAIKAGRKVATGVSIREDQTRLMAKTLVEFVNFGYALTASGEEIVVTPATDYETRIKVASAFYDDLEFVGFREQVEGEQADLANFSPTASAS